MILFAWLTLICLPVLLASEAVGYMILIPNYLFFQQSHENLKEFFGSLDFVRQRLQSPLGEDFKKMCRSYWQAPFLQTHISNLIKKLTRADVLNIVETGNMNEINFFFDRHFECYDVSILDVLTPQTLNMHLFPVENMSSSILNRMRLSPLKNVLFARSRLGLISNFRNIFHNLPPSFWTDFDIFAEPQLAVYFSPFALPDFEDFRIPYPEGSRITRAPELSEIFQGTILHLLKQLWFNSQPILTQLPKVDSRDVRNFTLIISILGYNLQSIIHLIIASGNLDTSLFSLTVKALHDINKALQDAINSRPDIATDLNQILESSYICYSSLTWSHLNSPESKFYSILRKYIGSYCKQKATMSSTLKFLQFPSGSFDYNSLSVIHKRLLLFPIFMMAEETVDEDFTAYIQTVADAFKNGHLMLLSFFNEIGLLRNLNYFVSQYPQHALPILEVPLQEKNSIFTFKPEILFKLVAFVDRNPYLAFDIILSSTVYREDSRNGPRNVILDSSDLAKAFDADLSGSSASAAPVQTLPKNISLPNYQYLDLAFVQYKSESSLIVLDLPDLSLDLKENIDDYSLIEYAFARYFKSLVSVQDSKSASSEAVEIYEFVAPNGYTSQFSESLVKQLSEFNENADEMPEDLNRQAPRFSVDAPNEIQYIEGVLSGIMQFIKNPNSSIIVRFPQILTTSGRGLLIEAISTFGRLLSLPQVRTVQFSESLGGFVPVPFLCPKVMALLGAWISLSWSLKSQLPWGFSDRYLKFLLYEWDDSSNVATDALILEMYPELFQGIKDRFRYALTSEDDFYLPLSFRPHRMFTIPAPHFADPSPFIFESRAFDIENRSVEHSRPTNQRLLAMGEASYSRMVLSYLRKNLLEGRLEFQRHFRLAFSPKLNKFFNYPTVFRFFHAAQIDVDDLISGLNFDAFETIRNDLPGATTRTIDARQLMSHFIRIIDKYSLQRFLCFVTSTGATPLGGFKNSPITIKPAKGVRLSTARTCIRSLIWYIDTTSASNTLRLLHDTINLSSGFVEFE